LFISSYIQSDFILRFISISYQVSGVTLFLL